MPLVIEWPREWYRFTRGIFALRSRSHVAQRHWSDGRTIYGPHSQLFFAQLTLAPQKLDDRGQAMSALIARLGGQAGLLRIGDPARRVPQYNRLNAAQSQTWSDTTNWSDGTGWATGNVPPFASLAAAAAQGDIYITVTGLPASVSRIVRSGDLVQLNPNGIADDVPSLYIVTGDGSSNASGSTTVEIRPPLRRGYAAGDQVQFDAPTSVFHLFSDTEGESEIDVALRASISLNLIEAIDRC